MALVFLSEGKDQSSPKGGIRNGNFQEWKELKIVILLEQTTRSPQRPFIPWTRERLILSRIAQESSETERFLSPSSGAFDRFKMKLGDQFLTGSPGDLYEKLNLEATS